MGPLRLATDLLKSIVGLSPVCYNQLTEAKVAAEW
jgi:hypothetical protein